MNPQSGAIISWGAAAVAVALGLELSGVHIGGANAIISFAVLLLFATNWEIMGKHRWWKAAGAALVLVLIALAAATLE